MSRCTQEILPHKESSSPKLNSAEAQKACLKVTSDLKLRGAWLLSRLSPGSCHSPACGKPCPTARPNETSYSSPLLSLQHPSPSSLLQGSCTCCSPCQEHSSPETYVAYPSLPCMSLLKCYLLRQPSLATLLLSSSPHFIFLHGPSELDTCLPYYRRTPLGQETLVGFVPCFIPRAWTK